MLFSLLSAHFYLTKSAFNINSKPGFPLKKKWSKGKNWFSLLNFIFLPPSSSLCLALNLHIQFLIKNNPKFSIRKGLVHLNNYNSSLIFPTLGILWFQKLKSKIKSFQTASLNLQLISLLGFIPTNSFPKAETFYEV